MYACVHVWGTRVRVWGHTRVEADVGNHLLFFHFIIGRRVSQANPELTHPVRLVPLPALGTLDSPPRLELQEGSHSPGTATHTASTLHAEPEPSPQPPLQVFLRQRSRDKIVLAWSRFQINN